MGGLHTHTHTAVAGGRAARTQQWWKRDVVQHADHYCRLPRNDCLETFHFSERDWGIYLVREGAFIWG